MAAALRGFQIFVKPVGARCNLDCRYCYYSRRKNLYPQEQLPVMSDGLLERYIKQHIEACPDEIIRFSWHGGEPTILGLGTFHRIVELQRKYKPADKRIANGMQTNGTLLDDEWCRFFADEVFQIGLSLDGPKEIHDRFRVAKDGCGSFEKTIRGYELLRKHSVACDILCVVNAYNVQHPLEIYRFFKEIGATYVSFLPMVEFEANAARCVSELTLPAESWGRFLCKVFDEWLDNDIGKIKIQIFEEAAKTAFGLEHSLCIFRPVCGDIPVIEHNGDFFSCDHFVDTRHRIGNINQTPLVDMIESRQQRAFGNAKLESLPRLCINCEVRAMCNGECPKNRFIKTPDGESGLNYLCSGYKRFFNHCRSWVEEVGRQWRHQTFKQDETASKALNAHKATEKPSVGRNDPCPCGSGLKYKKCCMVKKG